MPSNILCRVYTLKELAIEHKGSQAYYNAKAAARPVREAAKHAHLKMLFQDFESWLYVTRFQSRSVRVQTNFEEVKGVALTTTVKKFLNLFSDPDGQQWLKRFEEHTGYPCQLKIYTGLSNPIPEADTLELSFELSGRVGVPKGLNPVLSDELKSLAEEFSRYLVVAVNHQLKQAIELFRQQEQDDECPGAWFTREGRLVDALTDFDINVPIHELRRICNLPDFFKHVGGLANYILEDEGETEDYEQTLRDTGAVEDPDHVLYKALYVTGRLDQLPKLEDE